MPYLVMPYLEGGSLKDRIEAVGPEGEAGPLSARDAPRLADGRGPGAGFPPRPGAHPSRRQAGEHPLRPPRQRLPRRLRRHRDGGARRRTRIPRAVRSRLTAPGFLLGTPNYVAPELVMGHRADGRADQYSLALTVHESLTGWNFMEGPTPSATMVNQTKVEPPALGELLQDVPPGLSEAVLRGLSKEPSGQTVRELRRAWPARCSSTSPRRSPAGRPRPRSWSRRRRRGSPAGSPVRPAGVCCRWSASTSAGGSPAPDAGRRRWSKSSRGRSGSA